jgi:hypothetical protein
MKFWTLLLAVWGSLNLLLVSGGLFTLPLPTSRFRYRFPSCVPNRRLTEVPTDPVQRQRRVCFIPQCRLGEQW